MWVQFFPEIQNPIWMPAHVANKVESLTYVEDVARAVLAVVERGEAVWNQAYNLAMDEEFSLANILLRMRDQLGVPEVGPTTILVHIITSTSQVVGNSETTEKSFYLYPTVFTGSLDISKAKTMLGFTPTPADEAFKATLDWYKEAFVKFPSHRDSILTDLFQTAIPKENRSSNIFWGDLQFLPRTVFRDAVYLAIDRELTKLGHKEEKYAKKKKGDLGSLPTAPTVPKKPSGDGAGDGGKDEL